MCEDNNEILSCPIPLQSVKGPCMQTHDHQRRGLIGVHNSDRVYYQQDSPRQASRKNVQLVQVVEKVGMLIGLSPVIAF